MGLKSPCSFNFSPCCAHSGMHISVQHKNFHIWREITYFLLTPSQNLLPGTLRATGCPIPAYRVTNCFEQWVPLCDWGSSDIQRLNLAKLKNNNVLVPVGKKQTNKQTIEKNSLENIMNEHHLKKTEHRDKWHSVHMCRLTYMKFITVVITVVMESYEDNEIN